MEKGLEHPQDEVYDVNGLKFVFWGLIMTLINIKIQYVDIVPDFIGYILVAKGLSDIESYDSCFAKAKKMAFVMTALSIINVYQPPIKAAVSEYGIMGTAEGMITFTTGLFGLTGFVSTLYGITMVVVDLVLIYAFCKGLRNIFEYLGEMEMAGSCNNRWHLILYVNIGIALTYIVVYLAPTVGTIMAIAFGLAGLAAMIMLLVFIIGARNRIDGEKIHRDIYIDGEME